MSGTWARSAVGLLSGLVFLSVSEDARAQRTPVAPWQALSQPASPGFIPGDVAPGPLGSLDGTVRDDRGQPIAGVVVTAIGATTMFAVTDERGHYQLTTLTPGPYLVRAHSSGHISPKPRFIDIRPRARTTASFAIRKSSVAPTVLAAGIGVTATQPEHEPEAESTSVPAVLDVADTGEDDHGDTAWRLRHLRRGVLRDVSVPSDLLAEDDDPFDTTRAVAVRLGRAVSSHARAATSFFADVPLFCQVNLLTTNMFDSPQQLLSGASMARGIAYVKVGAPVGDHADWIVRGALNEGDLSSWIIAGAYQTRGPARRARDIGMSYSTQRYEGGNPLALRDVSEGTRNAGSIYAFETFNLTPALAIAYGGRYERFDYLDERNLLSPRAEVTLKPIAHTRVAVALSSRSDAPGAQEFQPPTEEGIWLPPQRTFSTAERGRPLRAQRATQMSATAERDWGRTTIALRAFTQRVDGQMVTVFGADTPDVPGTTIGHYVVSTAGNVDAQGGSLAMRTDFGPRFRASVAYSTALAQMTAMRDVGYILLVPPSAVRARRERLQDITTTVQAEVPETATRVLVFYRVGNGYARPGASDEARIDSRFDVQVRQALPFLNFTSAKWEMLIAVRNSFRDVTSEQTVYDELLTVQPPKRIIGGVTLHF
jgi:hypothetical protein